MSDHVHEEGNKCINIPLVMGMFIPATLKCSEMKVGV